MSEGWAPAPSPQAWLARHSSDVDVDTRAWEFLCSYTGALSDAELADELEEDGDRNPVILRAIEMLRTHWTPAHWKSAP